MQIRLKRTKKESAVNSEDKNQSVCFPQIEHEVNNKEKFSWHKNSPQEKP